MTAKNGDFGNSNWRNGDWDTVTAKNGDFGNSNWRNGGWDTVTGKTVIWKTATGEMVTGTQ